MHVGTWLCHMIHYSILIGPFRLYQGKQLPLCDPIEGVLHRPDKDQHQIYTFPLPHSLHQGLPPVLHCTSGRTVFADCCSSEEQGLHACVQARCKLDCQRVTRHTPHFFQPHGQLHQTQSEGGREGGREGGSEHGEKYQL